jgi:virginiamycin B lyase
MRVTEYEVGPGAYGVAIAADGAVWTTRVDAGELVRLDPDGELSRISWDAPRSRPMVVTRVGDEVWFTCGDGHLGRVDRTSTVSRLSVRTAGSTPYGICAGPDKGIWYTLMDRDLVGHVGPDGQSEAVAMPEGSMPSMITADSRGTLWVTLNQADAVASVTATGEVTVHPLPTSGGAPVGIAAGPECVWFAEIGAGQLGRIGVDGVITEIALSDPASRPHAVAATDDGGCWATLWASSSAVRLDSGGGVVDEVRFAAGAEPHGIAVAADGSVWVALEAGSLVHLTAE